MELISKKDKELACAYYMIHLKSMGSGEHAQFRGLTSSQGSCLVYSLALRHGESFLK